MINSSRDRNLRKGASLKFCLTQVGELAKVMQSRASKATVGPQGFVLTGWELVEDFELGSDLSTDHAGCCVEAVEMEQNWGFVLQSPGER